MYFRVIRWLRRRINVLLISLIAVFLIRNGIRESLLLNPEGLPGNFPLAGIKSEPRRGGREQGVCCAHPGLLSCPSGGLLNPDYS